MIESSEELSKEQIRSINLFILFCIFYIQDFYFLFFIFYFLSVFLKLSFNDQNYNDSNINIFRIYHRNFIIISTRQEFYILFHKFERYSNFLSRILKINHICEYL